MLLLPIDKNKTKAGYHKDLIEKEENINGGNKP